MSIKIHELGHVVLYVTRLAPMVHFYENVLGFKKVAQRAGVAVFSSGRTHHELLLLEIGGAPHASRTPKPGLYHIGFKIGTTDKELKEALSTLEKEGVRFVGASDHTVTHSLYILDPDGNELELYVDVNDSWKRNPMDIVAPIRPLDLD